MRFCSLKTYLSTLCQLISLHPTIFWRDCGTNLGGSCFEFISKPWEPFRPLISTVCEFVLGIYSATWTFTHRYTAGYVCLSWALPHPFSGITCCFKLGSVLLNPSFSSLNIRCWLYLPVFWGWDRVTSFLYFFAEYDGISSWFVFFRIHLSA